MLIAQHSVAGEDLVHSPETGTIFSSEISVEKRNLPYQTLRAHQRALSIQSISRRARCALAAVAQTVDVRRPLASVFAHREYLADRAGLSERTWYRAEQDLIDAGLIRVADQTRKSRGGRFGAAYIYLTQIASDLLGLTGEPVKAATRIAPTSDGGSALSDAQAQEVSRESAANATGSPLTPDSFNSPSATLADPFTNKVYLSPLSQKRQQGELPEDVQPLLTLGFHKFYIFKLMAQARRKHGKKLGDVVTACWEQLRTARRPINYLLKLLGSSSDFAWLARQRAAKRVEAAQNEQEAERREADVEALKGQTFYNDGGTRRFEVSRDGSTLTVHEARNGVTHSAIGNWISEFSTALRDGKVLAATNALAEQYRRALPDSGELNRTAVAPDASSRAAARLAAVASARTALAKFSAGGIRGKQARTRA